MPKLIPTNIVTGFLGAGKTTAILDALRRKPAAEKWAVLVNEFGEIGIDGAILASSGAEIREVAGGCMCCVADLPMKVALNNLIAKVRPDRLLIEPSGLGHPREIIDTLRGEYYLDVLDLRAVLCLIDPRKMREPRYLDNSIFSEQLRVADIVVANKTDLCNEEDERVFRNFVAQQLQKKHIGWVAHGHFDLSWFDCAHAAPRIATTQKLSQVDTPLSRPLFPDSTAPLPVVLLPGTPFARREHRNDDYSSCGWLFAADTRFNFQRLLSLMSGLNVRRMKGVLQTDRGGYIFNADDGVLAVNEIDGAINSAVEMIADDDVDWLAIEQQLLAARC